MQYSTTIRKRLKGTRQEWTACLIYKDQVTGLRKERSKSAGSRTEARRIERELAQEFVTGGPAWVESHAMTFEQLVRHCEETKNWKAEYDEEDRKYLFDTDAEMYDAQSTHFSEFFGKMSVRDIKVMHLRIYRIAGCEVREKMG